MVVSNEFNYNNQKSLDSHYENYQKKKKILLLKKINLNWMMINKGLLLKIKHENLLVINKSIKENI